MKTAGTKHKSPIKCIYYVLYLHHNTSTPTRSTMGSWLTTAAAEPELPASEDPAAAAASVTLAAQCLAHAFALHQTVAPSIVSEVCKTTVSPLAKVSVEGDHAALSEE